MTGLRDEPYIPSLLYKQLSDGKQALLTHQAEAHVKSLVVETLQDWKEEKDWKEETLEESPFFPGWKKKLRSQFGFEIS
jgi:hypothetical protein